MIDLIDLLKRVVSDGQPTAALLSACQACVAAALQAGTAASHLMRQLLSAARREQQPALRWAVAALYLLPHMNGDGALACQRTNSGVLTSHRDCI